MVDKSDNIYNKTMIKKRSKYLGLSNQGATCYMNSLLQSLFMTYEFRNALYQWEYNEKEDGDKKDCILLQLQLLFARLETQNIKEYVDTKQLIKSFQWESGDAFKQHDVQEFCTVLFDAIEISLKGSLQESFIRQLYQGTSQSYVKCKVCGYESLNDDTFLYLSLTVKNDIDKVYNPTIDKALENYLKPEHLEGDNKYYCEKCKVKVDAIKGTKFKTFPKILALHLNRFDLDYITFLRKKLNNKVTFPLILNMNKFLKNYEQVVKINQDDPQNNISVKIEDDNNNNNNNSIGNKLYSSNEFYDYYDDIYDNDLHAKGYRQLIQKYKSPSSTYEDLPRKLNSDIKPNINHVVYDDYGAKISKKQNFIDNGIDIASNKMNKEEMIENLIKFKQAKNTFDKRLSMFNSPAKLDQNIGKSTPSSDLSTKDSESDAYAILGLMDPIRICDRNRQNDNIVEDNEVDDYQDEDLLSKYENEFKDGKYVYELYSIMIHSGSAGGGHYYTYIKSFENNKWYNFNDTSVKNIDPLEISKVFGDENPKYDAGCSAYMLMYRLIEKNENPQLKRQTPKIPESIMKMLNEEYEIERKMQEMEKKLKEEKERELKLRVFCKGEEKVISLFKTNTFEDFIKAISKSFDIKEDITNYRIRSYSVYEEVMQDTYTNKESMALEDLGIKTQKCFMVEFKENKEEFEEYNPKSRVIKINLWKENIQSLEEKVLDPKKIFIDENASLKELMLAIEKKFNIPTFKQLIIKRKAYGESKDAEILNKDPNLLIKNLNFHKIYNGLNLFVEEVDNIEEIKSSKWEQEFELDRYRSLIKFNDPIKNEEGIPPEYIYHITVDSRITLHELKLKFAEILKIDIDKFLLKIGGRLGNELKDMQNKLIDSKITNMTSIYLELGTPSKSGEYRVKFCLGGLSPENHDSLIYEFEELFELPVSNNEKVLDLKKRLIFELKKNSNINDINVDRIRLRERNSESLGSILHNEKILKDYTLYDKKVIVIEILDKKDDSIPSQIMLIIKKWDLEAFELSLPKEILINKDNTTMNEFGTQLSTLFSIPIERISCYKVTNLWKFDRSDLLIDDGKWEKLDGNSNKTCNYPWYLTKDGQLLIVRDDVIIKGITNNPTLIEAKDKIIEKQKNSKKGVSFHFNLPEVPLKIGVKKVNNENKKEVKDDSDFGNKKENKIDAMKRSQDI